MQTNWTHCAINLFIILILKEIWNSILLICNAQIYTLDLEGLTNNLNDLVDTRKGKTYMDNFDNNVVMYDTMRGMWLIVYM